MRVTCIGGPLHGRQIEIADHVRIYRVPDAEVRMQYLLLGKSTILRPGAGHVGSVAFFALSTIPQAEVIRLIRGHLHDCRLAREAEWRDRAADRPESAKNLHEVLYVSELAPDASLVDAGDIARHARPANRRLDVTGLLLFDGELFSQHLEGDADAVQALLRKILLDGRHTQVKVLHNAALTRRRFTRFHMAYDFLEEADALERLKRLHGDRAVHAFLQAVPALQGE